MLMWSQLIGANARKESSNWQVRRPRDLAYSTLTTVVLTCDSDLFLRYAVYIGYIYANGPTLGNTHILKQKKLSSVAPSLCIDMHTPYGPTREAKLRGSLSPMLA